MKVGDLVKYYVARECRTGIIVGFDEENDPIVRDNETGIATRWWSNVLEVISECR